MGAEGGSGDIAETEEVPEREEVSIHGTTGTTVPPTQGNGVDFEPPDEPPTIAAVREDVTTELVEWFSEAYDDDSPFDSVLSRHEQPGVDFLEQSYFDFSYLGDLDEVERYWVNKPHAYVSILYNKPRQTYTYQVVEPTLDEFERYLRVDLIQTIRNRLMYRDISGDESSRREVFEDELVQVITDHAATVDPGSIHKLRYYLIRDLVDFGRIDPLMRDGSIEDISCDGTDVPVFIYHRQYRDLRTNISFGRERLNSLVVRLAQQAGKHLSISDPLIDASLPDGSRIQLTLGGDVASRGSNFTIRKFSDTPFTPVDLINWNTFSIEQMAYFWLCIENNCSLVFAGGTGSGKTTSLNAVSFFIPPDSKVVSIEDTREIVLANENWIQSVTREAVGGRGDIETYSLLQTALRQRPEYLLVGEIRTDQRVALTFFQAISTGHTCYTTIHADTLDGALSRLQNPPLSVPTQMLGELDIVSIQKQASVGEDRLRRNQTVAELSSTPEGDLEKTVTFSRDAKTDTHERRADSKALAEVADLRGWSAAQLDQELADRERVLTYLVDEDITDYASVAAVIKTFQRNSEYVMDRIETDSLDPSSLVGVL